MNFDFFQSIRQKGQFRSRTRGEEVNYPHTFLVKGFLVIVSSVKNVQCTHTFLIAGNVDYNVILGGDCMCRRDIHFKSGMNTLQVKGRRIN